MADRDNAAEQAADELYGLALERFTERRNDLARALRRDGDKSAADSVKALRKPNQTAWALNQVARRQAGDVARLLEAGADLRRAQEAVMSGGDPKELASATKEERRVAAELVDASAAVAAEGGVGETDSLRERIRSTLEAAVRDAAVGQALQTGRLLGDHQAAGLPDLSGWALPAAAPAQKIRPQRKADHTKGGKEDKQKREAEEREQRSRKDIDDARRRLETARERQGSTAGALEQAASAAREARTRADQAVSAAEDAEEAQRSQQTELDAAEAEVERLEDELERAEG